MSQAFCGPQQLKHQLNHQLRQEAKRTPAPPEKQALVPDPRLDSPVLDLNSLNIDHWHTKSQRWRKMSVVHHSVAKRCISIFPRARGHITKVLKVESSWQSPHTACHKNAFFVTNDVGVIRQRFAQPDTFAPPWSSLFVRFDVP